MTREDRFLLFRQGLSALLVASSPDVLRLRGLDELVPGVGMGDIDQPLGPLPSVHPLDVECSVFRHEDMGDGPRNGHDPSRREVGDDPRLDIAVLVLIAGRETNEGLAALRLITGENEIELSPRAGDLAEARGLGTDLAIQIHLNGVVDGNEIVIGGGNGRFVGVTDRIGGATRVVVKKVVKDLGTQGKGIDDLVGIDLFWLLPTCLHSAIIFPPSL